MDGGQQGTRCQKLSPILEPNQRSCKSKS